MGTDVSPLTWLGGNPGDGWYEMTAGLTVLLNGQDPGVELDLVAGGGEENVTRVHNGEAELGMSTDVVVGAAFNGAPPFDTALRNLRVLGWGWSALPYNLLRAADAPEDFAASVSGPGLRIGVPPKDTTDELMFEQVVSYYGTDYAEITRRDGRVLLHGYDALIEALNAGEIDYVFGATTMPAPSIAQAHAGARPVELTALPTELIGHLAVRFGCVPGMIPAGTYPGLQRRDTATATAFVQTVFVVSERLAEPSAYAVTSLLLRNLEGLATVHPSLARFNPYTAWRNVPAPVHPGAARAYRELGFMS